MPIDVFCECGHLNEVDEKLAGGIVNCAGCGRAVQVEGLCDPYWRSIQGVAVVGWAGATAWAYVSAGLMWALIVGLAGAALLWLASRAF